MRNDSSPWSGRDLDSLDVARRFTGLCGIVDRLHSEPVVGGAAEGHLEADGHVGGHRRPAFADCGQVRFRDLQVLRGLGNREIKRPDAVFEQGFSGMV